MGGKVLDLPIIRVYHDGLAEGEAEHKRLEYEIETLNRIMKHSQASRHFL